MFVDFIKQRATLIVFLLGVAATVGFGSWCYSKGKAVERSDWQKKENAELKAKNDALIERQQEIERLTRERNKAQQDLATATSSLSTQLQEALDKNDQETEATIERLLNDNRELQKHSRVLEANTATAELAATTLGRYASGQARLSDEAVRFFGREAGRCNAVVHQLTACQGTIKLWYDETKAYNDKYFGVDAQKNN